MKDRLDSDLENYFNTQDKWEKETNEYKENLAYDLEEVLTNYDLNKEDKIEVLEKILEEL